MRCTIRGAGATIARLLGEVLSKAFAEQPQRLSEWTALRRAAADADERAERLSRLSELISAGLLRPHISHAFPLKEVKDALRAKWERQVTGSCVVNP